MEEERVTLAVGSASSCGWRILDVLPDAWGDALRVERTIAGGEVVSERASRELGELSLVRLAREWIRPGVGLPRR